MQEELEAARAVRAALEQAAAGLVERQVVVDLVALAAVAGEHLLILGPPGTAKSQAVRQVAQALGGRYFEYLLGRYTEPSELVGPIDLRRLRDGVVETQTAGMLPEAEVAFLDEVFLGSTAILNTLLGLLNERQFRRGATSVRVPLRVCVGAANQLPEDDSLAAFADRFLLRCFVEPIEDALLEDLLEQGWRLDHAAPVAAVAMADLDRLAAAARAVDLAEVRPRLAAAIRTLRGAGIALSDRRIVKAQRLVAAAAALDGRAVATAADLWPIIYAVPTAEAQATARDALRDVLADAASTVMTAAAAAAAQSVAARAAHAVAQARALLAGGDAAGPDADRRLEAMVRAIDAGFATDQLTVDLAAVRATLIDALSAARATRSDDAHRT